MGACAFRQDKELHRIHYLDGRIKKIHDAIVKSGKQKFGDEFHWSMWYTLKVRPFQVKAAGREVRPPGSTLSIWKLPTC